MKQGWEYKKLGEVCEFKRGLTYAGGDEVSMSNNCVLRSNNVNLETMALDLTELKYLRPDFNIPSEKKVKKDSILICMSNGSKQHIGKVAYIDKEMDYAFGGFMGLIIPNNNTCSKYIYFGCRSALFKKFLGGIGEGANIKNLRFQDLEKFSIPLPPLSEQQAIVAELDKINEVIALKKAQLKDLDLLAQSIFYDMFGDPIENPKGWEVKKLEDVSTLLNGRAYKQNELLDSGKYKVLRVGNFFTNDNYYYSDIELSDDKYCDNGDLLFAWSASFGAFIWQGGKVIYHYHIWKVLFDENRLNIQYYRYLLNTMTSYFMKDVHGIGMVHLTKNGMEKYILPLPPLSLQQEFAKKIEAIEAQKTAIKQSLAEAETLLASRMDYWFN